MGIGGLIKYIQTKIEAPDLITTIESGTIDVPCLYLDFNSFVHMAYQDCVFSINDIILDMIAMDEPFMWDQEPGGSIIPLDEFVTRIQRLGMIVPRMFPSRSVETADQCKKYCFTHLVQQFNSQMAHFVFLRIKPLVERVLEFFQSATLQHVFISFDGVPNKSKIMLQAEGKRKVAILRSLQEQLWQRMQTRMQNCPQDKILQYRGMYESYRIEDTKNIILPGTEFMRGITRLTTEWTSQLGIDRKFSVEVSDTYTPGEGEFKIASHISNYPDSNKKHIICTPDADVTLLSIILRNEHGRQVDVVHYSQEEQKYYHIHSDRIMNMIHELFEVKQTDSALYRKRLIDDVVFLISFLGNDILPRVSSIQVQNLPVILSTYKAHVRASGTLSPFLLTLREGRRGINLTSFTKFLNRCRTWERQVAQFNYMKKKFGPQFDTLYTELLGHQHADGGEFDKFVVEYNEFCKKIPTVQTHESVQHEKRPPIRPLSGFRFTRNIENNHFLKRAFVQKRQKWVVPTGPEPNTPFRVPCTPLLSKQFHKTLGLNLAKEIERSDKGFFSQHFKNQISESLSASITTDTDVVQVTPLKNKKSMDSLSYDYNITASGRFAPPQVRTSPFKKTLIDHNNNKRQTETRESIKLAMFLQEEDKEAFVVDQLLDPLCEQVERFDLVRIENHGKKMYKTKQWGRYGDSLIDAALRWNNSNNHHHQKDIRQMYIDYLIGLTMLIQNYWNPHLCVNQPNTWWYQWPVAPLISQLSYYLSQQSQSKTLFHLEDHIECVIQECNITPDMTFTPEAHLAYTVPITSLNIHCQVFPTKWVHDLQMRAYAENNDRTVQSISSLWLKRDPIVWSIYPIVSPTIPVLRDVQPLHPERTEKWFTGPFGAPSSHWWKDQQFIAAVCEFLVRNVPDS